MLFASCRDVRVPTVPAGEPSSDGLPVGAVVVVKVWSWLPVGGGPLLATGISGSGGPVDVGIVERVPEGGAVIGESAGGAAS